MKVDKIKIAFILPSMTLGGAEKVISILLKYLSREKFDIVLILIKKEGVFVDEIPEDIKVIDLGSRKIRHSVFKIITTIWRLKPDFVFSTLGYLNVFLLLLKFSFPRKTKLLARESNIPSKINSDEKYGYILNFLYKLLYPHLDRIICQSKDMKNDLISNYNISEEKIEIIYNPVDIERINTLSIAGSDPFLKQDRIILLAAGRLEYQKGFDLLIETFSKLETGKFYLVIIGEGSEKEKLLKLAEAYNIEKDIFFAGFQKNPYLWMKNADLFILSSRYEGFPNVVLETMACGTPVISFECPGGLNEIIVKGVNGALAKNGEPNSLAAKIDAYSQIPFDSKEIIEYTAEHYAIEKIISKYDKIFRRILNRNDQ